MDETTPGTWQLLPPSSPHYACEHSGSCHLRPLVRFQQGQAIYVVNHYYCWPHAIAHGMQPPPGLTEHVALNWELYSWDGTTPTVWRGGHSASSDTDIFKQLSDAISQRGQLL